jgi:hypothetical protein
LQTQAEQELASSMRQVEAQFCAGLSQIQEPQVLLIEHHHLDIVEAVHEVKNSNMRELAVSRDSLLRQVSPCQTLLEELITKRYLLLPRYRRSPDVIIYRKIICLLKSFEIPYQIIVVELNNQLIKTDLNSSILNVVE